MKPKKVIPTLMDRQMSRRAILRACASFAAGTTALLALETEAALLRGEVRDAQAAGQDTSFLTKLLEAVIATMALIGMLCEWQTDTLLKEICFFHVHGTGRPPENTQVQSFEPGSVHLQLA